MFTAGIQLLTAQVTQNNKILSFGNLSVYLVLLFGMYLKIMVEVQNERLNFQECLGNSFGPEWETVFLTFRKSLDGWAICCILNGRSELFSVQYRWCMTNEGTTIPRTAKVEEIEVYGIAMSNVDRWRLNAPNQSFWVENETSHSPTVDMNYRHNVYTNAELPGTWQAAFKASASASTKSFTPYFLVSYYCEYGDE